jgi:hypothetical protein
MYEYSQDILYLNKPMDFPTKAVAIGFVRVVLAACIVKIQLGATTECACSNDGV